MISFLMAVGRKDYLNQAVYSILRQEYQEWELLIYNNKRLNLFCNDSRIKIIDTDDWPPAKCYNHGIEHAESRHILIATDDDIYFPERAGITSHYLNNGFDYVAGSCIEIDIDGKPTKYIKLKQYHLDYIKRITNIFSLPFVGFNREKVPKFNESFKCSYDYLFNLECAMSGLNFKVLSIPLGLKRNWQGSLWNSATRAEKEDEIYRIRSMYGSEIKDCDKLTANKFIAT